MASILNVAEAVKKQSDEAIVKKRIKLLVQQCFENPELNQEVLVQFLNKKIESEWTDNLKTISITVKEIQPLFLARKDVHKLVKQFIQQCFENPQINYEVLLRFFNRKIQWETINAFILHGEVVECKLCRETSVTGIWCQPCIHKRKPYCCYCCILLGIPFYR